MRAMGLDERFVDRERDRLAAALDDAAPARP
jgi:hypothetical protein